MNRLITLFAVLITALVSACGKGGCTDLVPDPDFDFHNYDALDAADMNGDGLTDLVVASDLVYLSDPAAQQCGATADSDSYIFVLLQDIQAPGTFLVWQKVPLFSSNASTLKLTDLNGDNLPDVIVTHRWLSKTFEVLLHDPQNPGTLLAPESFTTVSRPHQIAVGDIDMDGYPDIAIAGESTIAWHRQRSDGNFQERSDIGPGADSLVLIDFDFDGLLDVATHDGTPDGDVLIYTQEQHLPGNFALWQSIRLGTTMWSVGAGDLNEDGKPDIATAGLTDNWFRILQTASNPLTFKRHLPRYHAETYLYVSPLIVDLNGDGKEDVVVSSANVSIFLQEDVAGEFGRKTVYKLPPGEAFLTGEIVAIAIADLLQGLWLFAIEAKAGFDDVSFALVENLQQATELHEHVRLAQSLQRVCRVGVIEALVHRQADSTLKGRHIERSGRLA
jgi:hypothetical protein